MKMKDRYTGKQIFQVLSVTLACEACKDAGKAADCIHLLVSVCIPTLYARM